MLFEYEVWIDWLITPQVTGSDHSWIPIKGITRSQCTPDQEKTLLMTKKGNYCYRVMHFGLKNVGATYQRSVIQETLSQPSVSLETQLVAIISIVEPGNSWIISILKYIEEGMKPNEMKEAALSSTREGD